MAVPRPPDDLMFVGNPAHWDVVGNEFSGYLRELCGLQPEHHVLDIGCGVGRIAAPLTDYVTGGYAGFDVNERGIRWCVENITTRYPHFRFDYVDLYNKRYNPGGKLDSATFSFPYEDDRFDVAFATSLFTHLLAEGMRRYLTELRRTLRGTALLTFYLWTDEAQESLERDPFGRPSFRFDRGDYRIENAEIPEDVVAYPQRVVTDALGAAGLELRSVHPGKWSGRADGFSWQDIIVVA